MNRTRIFDKVTVDLVESLDHLYNSLSGFTMKYKPTYYRVTSADLMRPDMISYKAYGTVDFWWIIAVVNNIDDCFNDMAVGDLFKIPNILDVYAFQRSKQLR